MKPLSRIILFAVLPAAGLVGCAAGKLGNWEPVVDMKGVNAAQYQSDLQECREYTEQVSVAQRTATGAAGGAVVGGVLGAVLSDSDLAKRTAGAGAVTGGVQGAGSAVSEQHRILRNCLIGRGYRVLN